MKRVKILGVILIVALVLSTALVACSGSTTTVTTTVGGGSAVTSTVTTTAPAKTVTNTVTTTAAASTTTSKVYTIRWQAMLPAGGDNYNWEKENLINVIEKAGGGRIKIDFVGSGSIVPDMEMHTAVNKGVLDMCTSSSGYLSGTFPAAALDRGYPGMYRNWEDMLFLRYLGFTDVLRQGYKEVLGVYYVNSAIDWGGDLMSTKPINSLAEIKGKKIRVTGTLGQVLGKAGASVVTMPGTELYTSLQTGVIDGAVYAKLIDAAQLGLTEVAKYSVLDLIRPQFSGLILANPNFWNSLPADLQQIITLAIDEYDNEKANIRNFWKGKQAVADFVAKGGTTIRWSDADFNTMSQISSDLVKDLLAKDTVWAPKLVEIINKLQAAR